MEVEEVKMRSSAWFDQVRIALALVVFLGKGGDEFGKALFLLLL